MDLGMFGFCMVETCIFFMHHCLLRGAYFGKEGGGYPGRGS